MYLGISRGHEIEAMGQGLALGGNRMAFKLPSERKMTSEERRFRAESDLRALQQAQEIQGDRARLGAAQRVAKDQMRALDRVAKANSGRAG